MNDAKRLVKEAERAARDSETWADLSNFLFNPVDGLVAKAYPTRAARVAFIQTDEYRAIRRLLADARQRHGLVEGATPRKTDRLVVQLPQSIHTALEREAAAEGISLDQLVLEKLAVGLGYPADDSLSAAETDGQPESVSSQRAHR
jgi:predicted HicB family RNase H-like nuclease